VVSQLFELITLRKKSFKFNINISPFQMASTFDRTIMEYGTFPLPSQRSKQYVIIQHARTLFHVGIICMK